MLTRLEKKSSLTPAFSARESGPGVYQKCWKRIWRHFSWLSSRKDDWGVVLEVLKWILRTYSPSHMLQSQVPSTSPRVYSDSDRETWNFLQPQNPLNFMWYCKMSCCIFSSNWLLFPVRTSRTHTWTYQGNSWTFRRAVIFKKTNFRHV